MVNIVNCKRLCQYDSDIYCFSLRIWAEIYLQIYVMKHFEVDNLCDIKLQNIKMGNCTIVNTLHLFAYILFIYFVYSILALLIKLRTLIIIVYIRIFGDVLHSPRL